MQWILIWVSKNRPEIDSTHISKMFRHIVKNILIHSHTRILIFNEIVMVNLHKQVSNLNELILL